VFVKYLPQEFKKLEYQEQTLLNPKKILTEYDGKGDALGNLTQRWGSDKNHRGLDAGFTHWCNIFEARIAESLDAPSKSLPARPLGASKPPLLHRPPPSLRGS